MSAPTLAERTRVLRLAAARRRGMLAVRALRSPVLRWRLAPIHPDELLFVPPDLRTADPSFADELAAGQLGLAGHVLDLGGMSPFRLQPPGPAFAAALHAFGWLSHLRAAGTADAVRVARLLILDWIAVQRAGGPTDEAIVWRPDVAARRVDAWIINAGFVLEGAEPTLYRAMMRSLAGQIRSLDLMRRTAPPGAHRLASLTVLLLAELALAGYERHLPGVERDFLAELDRQILADGGDRGRNPAATLDLLLDLLPLHQAYLARQRRVPPRLTAKIKSMTGFLQDMRLGDGTLARFNGVGVTPADHLATVLALAAPVGTPAGDAALEIGPSRYARLAAGPTVIVVDCGAAPALEQACDAHAGCLSFEMSVGASRLVVNAGAATTATGEAEPVARSTASHSTLCLASTSSARLVRFPMLERLTGGSAVCGPPRVTAQILSEPPLQVLEATHDGYAARHGLVHARRLALAGDGLRLEGRDELRAASGDQRMPRDVPFAIHFHLPASTLAVVDASATAATITLPDGQVWRLEVEGARAAIETGTEFANVSGPRVSRQIVLRAATAGHSLVTWVLARRPEPAAIA